MRTHRRKVKFVQACFLMFSRRRAIDILDPCCVRIVPNYIHVTPCVPLAFQFYTHVPSVPKWNVCVPVLRSKVPSTLLLYSPA
ncbi:hypothetical protein FPV67DRAFT_1529905, partial [Lyophyllum atratum]